MSRDWRPYEQFVADRAIKQSQGTSLRDMKITWHIDGKEIEMGNKDAKTEFPELSFLYGDEFYSMYEEHADNPAVCRLFQEFEDALKEVEQQFLNGNIKQHENLSNVEFEKFVEQPIDAVVTEWFMGQLDAGFYYREENNRMLSEYMNYKIEQVVEKGEPLKNKAKKEKGEERE